MSHRRSFVSIATAWLVFVYLLSDAAPAEAYIDPGTGSLAFQVILATALGALVFVRRVRIRIVDAARRLFSRTSDVKPQKPE